MNNNKGFTLIELLIVVAIIGILVAIAIPNFMQARVKAKVANAQSGMRNLSNAIAVIYLDKKLIRYLPPSSRGYCDSFSFFTTPVAYLRSIDDARDPFYTKTKSQDDVEDFYVLPPACFYYVMKENNSLKDLLMLVAGRPYWMYPQYMFSRGPDKEFDSIQPMSGILGVQYDSSNGLFSVGNIQRFHKIIEN